MDLLHFQIDQSVILKKIHTVTLYKVNMLHHIACKGYTKAILQKTRYVQLEVYPTLT